jgi:hypothetical protein
MFWMLFTRLASELFFLIMSIIRSVMIKLLHWVIRMWGSLMSSFRRFLSIANASIALGILALYVFVLLGKGLYMIERILQMCHTLCIMIGRTQSPRMSQWFALVFTVTLCSVIIDWLFITKMFLFNKLLTWFVIHSQLPNFNRQRMRV